MLSRVENTSVPLECSRKNVTERSTNTPTLALLLCVPMLPVQLHRVRVVVRSLRWNTKVPLKSLS